MKMTIKISLDKGGVLTISNSSNEKLDIVKDDFLNNRELTGEDVFNVLNIKLYEKLDDFDIDEENLFVYTPGTHGKNNPSFAFDEIVNVFTQLSEFIKETNSDNVESN